MHAVITLIIIEFPIIIDIMNAIYTERDFVQALAS